MTNRTHRARVATAQGLTARDIIIVVGLLVALFAAASSTGLTRHVEMRRTSAIRIVEGQTLWEIAQDVELPGLSTAEKVAEIQKLNGLSGATLAAGMVVRVPASETFQDAVAMR
ncbi:MAG TPA: LysM peptidoglycan-binding domain-containing protein [Coriobacteriia bacterium]|nr:LysM peptidoglycan-binding domain-containing protein [Coriobacteriia bacterium]